MTQGAKRSVRRLLVSAGIRALGFGLLVAPLSACCLFASPPPPFPTCPGDPRCDGQSPTGSADPTSSRH